MRFSDYVLQQNGVWTPTLTAETPGNLVAGTGGSFGEYIRFGNLVHVFFRMQPSPFTHSTASGQAYIAGFPFTSDVDTAGPLEFQGITKAGYTDFCAISPAPGDTRFAFRAGASATSTGVVNITDMPSGGSLFLSAQVTFTIVPP